MPIYEYRCESCTHLFDSFVQSIGAATTQAAPDCPACSDGPATRVISRVAFIRPGTAGVGRAAYPTSWEQTGRGNAETIRYWQRRVERERSEEARDPELAGVRGEAAADRWRQAHPGPAAAGSATSDSDAGRAADWRQIPYINPGAGHAHAAPATVRAHAHPATS
jgi:putative FmdB family regulatory protein